MDSGTLLGREVPISTSVTHVLGLVKSYWPEAQIALLGDGVAIECEDDKFTKFVEEAEPVAEQIVKILE